MPMADVKDLVGDHLAELRAGRGDPAAGFGERFGVLLPAPVLPGRVAPFGVLVENHQRADALGGVALNERTIFLLIRLFRAEV
jgi:hypothetical protein